MAGDWIKVERSTVRKPEILLAAELLGLTRREAIGLFIEYFIWLDDNLDKSRNGSVTLVSRKIVDEALQCVGFAAAIERIGWAQFDDNSLTLTVINADRHNGTTAKSRSLATSRQQRFRNARPSTQALPEKRREEKNKEKHTKRKFVKPTVDEVRQYCVERKNGIDPQVFIDTNEAKGWLVGDTHTPMKDWKAVIRTWEANRTKKPSADITPYKVRA